MAPPATNSPYRDTVDKIHLAIDALGAVRVLLEHGAHVHATDEVFRVLVTEARNKANILKDFIIPEIATEIGAGLEARFQTSG